MLRILAIVLLVGNALLLVAQFGLFDRLTGANSGQPPQREPERLLRQVDPQAVRILSPQAASAALAAAAASAAQSATAASNARAQACLEAGPFNASEAEAAQRSLRDAGLAPGSWQALTSEDNGAFMVYMGRYADRETLQRKLDELKRLKLEAEELRGKPELQPGLNLGRFSQRAEADAALAKMTQHGVRTARVITLRQAQSQTLLRLPAADAATQARLAGLAMPSGPGFAACVDAPAAAAPAAAPSGSAASAAAAPTGGGATTAKAAGGRPAAAAAPPRASVPLRSTASAPVRAGSAAAAAAAASVANDRR
jgi:hypothetical protein